MYVKLSLIQRKIVMVIIYRFHLCRFVSHERWSNLMMDLNDFVERMTQPSEIPSSFV